MKRYFYSIAFALMCLSCIKTIDFDENNQAKRLVLNSEIVPSDLFDGTVRKSTSILSDAPNAVVENGSVKLFEDGNLLSEFTFQNGSFLKKGLTFKEGKTYRVEISGDNQTISAETTIPEASPVLKIDTITSKTKNGESYMQVTITFSDNNATKDYYRIMAFEDQKYQTKDQDGNKQESERQTYPQLIQDDPAFGSVYSNLSNDLVDLNPDNSYNIFPDDYFDGKEYKLKFGVKPNYTWYSYDGSYGYYGYGNSQLIYGKTTLFFYKISKDLYNYLKYLQLYDTFKENPLAEPVPVYSNVKNGAGIFAGRTVMAQFTWEKNYKSSN